MLRILAPSPSLASFQDDGLGNAVKPHGNTAHVKRRQCVKAQTVLSKCSMRPLTILHFRNPVCQRLTCDTHVKTRVGAHTRVETRVAGTRSVWMRGKGASGLLCLRHARSQEARPRPWAPATSLVTATAPRLCYEDSARVLGP